MKGKTLLRVNYAALNQHHLSHESTGIFFIKAGWYRDEPFCCTDCGKLEIWTATQQKWWYEVAKGMIFQKAVRCRACMKIQKKNKEAQILKADGAQKRKDRA